ncbi:MAG: DMT family transporter [Pseudomonadota bacterium]
MPLSPNAQGALWMSVSMMGFVFNDAFMKSVSDDLPVMQAIFLRGLTAAVLVTALAWWRGALAYRPDRADWGRIGWRMVAEVGATCLFMSALFNMAFANAVAIIMVSPLAVTLAAAWALGEPVGWRRYTAIAVGFAGVLLIVGPGTQGFNVYALAALGAVGFSVLRDLSARTLNPAVPSLLPTVASIFSVTTVTGVVTAFSTWAPVDTRTLLALCGAGCLLPLGFYAGIRAMRVGEVGVVSPFRYTNLLWALALGFVVFGEIPSALALIGSAIIMATGLYSLHRERVRARG